MEHPDGTLLLINCLTLPVAIYELKCEEGLLFRREQKQFSRCEHFLWIGKVPNSSHSKPLNVFIK